ncbi:activator-dependent family glycosyltransferase [Nonomuraea sp. SYSU D8015]|uniref:activator-dependent family glycosyltransferase n=1 Tax=Nonomuraea sp. SYSU D8015 TaxID=2593644 RepID=UPI00166089CC|nr:activator-dependent family glycosyltransferase [Nonomuraea sp. SYSU D8015]
MRILIATQAERSHFFSLVTLAWALRTAGHEVRVASQPELTDAVADTGLTSVPVGHDHKFRHVMKRVADAEWPRFDMTVERTGDVLWEYLRDGYRRVVPWWWKVVNEPMIADLVAYCRQWRPDLVLWEPTTFAGAVAARACGAAHARLLWSLDLFARMRGLLLESMAAQPATEREDVLADWLGGHMARYGGQFSEDLTTGHFSIDYLPASMRLEVGVRQVPMRYVPYNGPAVVPQWLRTPPERPRVALTLGNSWATRLGRYAVPVPDILDALEGLDVEVVATLSAKQQAELPRVPDNARIVDYAPLHALAPTCQVVINQGGPGTVFTTAHYGVPQLILHYNWFDEPLLAKGITALGAGLAVPDTKVTADGVRERVARLLADSSFAAGAGRLREELAAMPSPNEIVPELERLTAEFR